LTRKNNVDKGGRGAKKGFGMAKFAEGTHRRRKGLWLRQAANAQREKTDREHHTGNVEITLESARE